MTDTLFLRFSDQEFEWLLFDQSGYKKIEGRGSAIEFNESVGNLFDGVAVFVAPGEDVLLSVVDIPTKQYRQLVQAVPYALEERLAVDVENCFFALGLRNDIGETQVSVVDRNLLASWLLRLEELCVEIRFVTSETNLISIKDKISVVLDTTRAHIRWPNGSGITALRSALPLALSERVADTQIIVFGREQDIEASRIQLGELEASGEVLDRQLTSASGFHLLCSEFCGSETNLLQGEFKVDEEISDVFVVWRSVAILTVVAIFLQLLALGGQGWYLERKATEYKTNASNLYTSVFPKDRNVRDLRRRWDAHLGRSELARGDFLPLFAASSQGLKEAGLTLNNVNFNEGRGDLIMQVSGKRSEEFVDFSQKLISQGLDAEIGAINQDDGNVRGSIKISFLGGGA